MPRCSAAWDSQFQRISLLEKAMPSTIRTYLIKIGAVIRKNTRKIYISLSSSYPYQELFEKLHLQSIQSKEKWTVPGPLMGVGRKCIKIYKNNPIFKKFY